MIGNLTLYPKLAAVPARLESPCSSRILLSETQLCVSSERSRYFNRTVSLIEHLAHPVGHYPLES